MRETIINADYEAFNSFLVEKDTNEDEVSIIIYDTSKVPSKEVNRITYKNTGTEYSHRFLSWYNLIFCSAGCSCAPDYKYMTYAVQQGKKTAATVYLDPDSNEGKKLVRDLPVDCDSVPYKETMIYVFHKGCLADYFSLDEIRAFYDLHHVCGIDWDKVEFLFAQPLSYFGDEDKCGFSLQTGGSRTELVVTGLLLGYPVESTISFIKNSGL